MNAAEFIQRLEKEKSTTFQLSDAEVHGKVDLGGVKLPENMQLHRVHFDSEVCLEGASISSILLDNCTLPRLGMRSVRVKTFLKIKRGEIDSLDLAHSKTEGFVELVRAHIGGSGVRRAVDLEHARIEGVLDLTGAKIEASKEAIYADNLRVGEFRAHTWQPAEGTPEGFRVSGDVRLRDASVRTELSLLEAAIGGTIHADRLHVGSTAILRPATCRQVQLRGARVDSNLEVDLSGIRCFGFEGGVVGGFIQLSGAERDNSPCTVLALRATQCTGPLDLRDARIAQLTLEHAHLGALQIVNCTVMRTNLLGLRVDRDFLARLRTQFPRGVKAQEMRVGQLCDLGAVVHATLELSGGTFGSLTLETGASPQPLKGASQPGWQLDARRIEVNRRFGWKPQTEPQWVDLSHARVGVLDDGNDVTRWPEASSPPRQSRALAALQSRTEVQLRKGIWIDGFVYESIALSAPDARGPEGLSFRGTPHRKASWGTIRRLLDSPWAEVRFWKGRQENEHRKNSRREWLMKQPGSSRGKSCGYLNALFHGASPNPLPQYAPQPIEHLADVLSRMGYSNDAAETEIWGQWLKSTRANSNRSPGETLVLKTWALLGFGARWFRVLVLWVLAGCLCYQFFEKDNMRPAYASRFKPWTEDADAVTASGKPLDIAHPDYRQFFYTVDTLVPFFDLRTEMFWLPNTLSSRTAHGLAVALGWAFGALFVISVSRRIKRW